MPLYTYQCPACELSRDVRRAINSTAIITCACNVPMKRIYTAPFINWNGRPPSAGGIHPTIKQHIDTAPERLDHIRAKYEGAYGHTPQQRGDHDTSSRL